MRLAISALVTILSVSSVASAQSLMVLPPPPSDNASDRSWYQDRVPIYVDGDVFYPAGASVFFDRNTMVPSGTFDRIQIYVDTTIEPHSIIYIPIGRGLLQPYERRRHGELAGTVGSKTPSFPIQRDAEALATGAEYVPPGMGYEVDERPEGLAVDARLAPQPTTSLGVVETGREAEMPVTGSTGLAPLPSGPVRTAIPPESNAGIWVDWNGMRWGLAGRAVTRLPGAFTAIGEYHGYAVYRGPEAGEELIYLPSRDELVVPYRREGAAAPRP